MRLLALLLALALRPCVVDQCDGDVCSVELPTGVTTLVPRLPGMAEGDPITCPTPN